MNALVAKIVALLSLFFSTVFFGVAPYKFVSGETSTRQRLVSLASCFAGGVFLGTCFLHLLPDVRESFHNAFHLYNIHPSYPVTEFVVVFGFFLVLIFEQGVLLFHRPSKRSRCSTGNVPPHGCHKTDACEKCEHQDGPRRPPLVPLCDDLNSKSLSPRAWDDANRPTTLSERISENETYNNCHLHDQNERQPLLGRSHEKDEAWEQPSASVRSLLLLAALSLHSLFEGLAMGLQDTSANVFEVFVAVVLHKCILAFSLGVQFVVSGSGLSGLLRAVLVFAIMSPIGVSIGIALTATGDENAADRQLATAILQGIATGTFLFVTFLEILAHELKEKRSAGKEQQMLKLFMALLGYSAMAGVQFLDD